MATLMKKNEEWEWDDLVDWYRAIDIRIQHAEATMAMEDVEEYLEDVEGRSRYLGLGFTPNMTRCGIAPVKETRRGQPDTLAFTSWAYETNGRKEELEAGRQVKKGASVNKCAALTFKAVRQWPWPPVIMSLQALQWAKTESCSQILPPTNNPIYPFARGLCSIKLYTTFNFGMTPPEDTLRKWISRAKDLVKRGKQTLETSHPTQTTNLSSHASEMDPPPRYTPCSILTTHGIPNAVWFEDALVLYGSNTAVFDLNLLVSDARKAADTLIAAGYQETELKSLFPDDERVCRGGIRLEPPERSSTDTAVLINASEWDYDLDQIDHSSAVPIPSPSAFLDSIMNHWLNLSDEEYGEKLLWSMSLVTLINYCYNLEGPNFELVGSPNFAQQLRPEHRELHYDLIGDYPQKCGISPYGKHRYHVLRSQQIKDGTFTPTPYPTSSIPPSLAGYPSLTGLSAHVPSSRRKNRSRDLLQSIEETTS